MDTAVVVDAFCRGLELGTQLPVEKIRDGRAYLVVPTPVPVHSEVILTTGGVEGLSLRTQVRGVVEQPMAGEGDPGMQLEILDSVDDAEAFWRRLANREEGEGASSPSSGEGEDSDRSEEMSTGGEGEVAAVKVKAEEEAPASPEAASKEGAKVAPESEGEKTVNKKKRRSRRKKKS